MGQSLRVETPAQDPQQHNNGGEFRDSLVMHWSVSGLKYGRKTGFGVCVVNSTFPLQPPSLSPPQGMLNHWDHVDESDLCFYTHMFFCAYFLMQQFTEKLLKLRNTAILFFFDLMEVFHTFESITTSSLVIILIINSVECKPMYTLTCTKSKKYIHETD